jgi:hypothetical protein
MVAAFDACEVDFFGDLAADTQGLWEVFEFVRLHHQDLRRGAGPRAWPRLHRVLDRVPAPHRAGAVQLTFADPRRLPNAPSSQPERR